MRSSTWRLEDLRNVILNLGFVGENLHTRQIFDCKKMFDQYPNASVSMTVTPPEGEPYPGTIERDGDLVIWDVRDSDLVAEGCGEVQLTFMVGEVVAKTCIGRTKVERSLGATGDIPTPIENWIEQAEEVIGEAEAATAAAEAAAEHQPIIDDNGYWAVWDADAEEYVATEYKAQGTDGHDGVGIVSIEKTGTSGLVDTYTITFTSGNPVTYTVTNGRDADPAELIDDTAGARDTDKVWSADKSSALLTEINSKADASAMDSLLNFGYKIIHGATINESGVIVATDTGKKLMCYKVVENTVIATTSGSTGVMELYAYYKNEPDFGSVSYNNSRTVINHLRNNDVPTGCKWIAIRCSENSAVEMAYPFGIMSVLDKTDAIYKTSINASGVVELTTGDSKLACFPVDAGSVINAVGTVELFGFFENRPTIGATSYDGSRVVQNNITDYTVPDGCKWIAIRCPIDANVSVSPVSNGNEIIELVPELDQTMGISVYGTLGAVKNGTQVSTAIKISKPIPVKAGDVVSLTGYLTSQCNIAWTPQDRINTYQGTPSYIPLSIGSSIGQRTETVTIERDGYIVVSVFHAYPCNVRITRSYNSQQEENARSAIDSQLRHNYVDTYDFVPNLEKKRINSILTYNADDKKSSDYIVNAVAYPNGEIIACRSGSGQVVKIANDGTETVLLTIANAQDWRGVFMDSELNVYVSPHSSQFSPAISNSDRGLYKLPYGGNSFTKVIKLCHDVYVTKWAANTRYAVNDVVFDNLTSIFYVCKTAHTSGNAIDLTKFNTIPAWTKNHAYAIGDLVIYRKIFYRCIYAHTSGSSMNTYAFDALTEYIDNDDTIWTMCEDALGNLYAGVYAHSLRDNPSVYFLQKGQTKWFLCHNFIMCGTLPASTYSTAPQHVHCINYNEYDRKLYAAVGETNTIVYSTDRGFSWTDMHIPCTYGQPTYVMGVKDGLLIGSDGHYACGVAKLTTDGKLLKHSGRTAPGFIFNIRRSDITGWLYAFTRIDNVVGDITKCPPVEAITDSSALNAWKADANTDPTYLAWWEDYNKWASVYYPEDAIRPQNSVMMVSRDEGETWEVFKTIKCSQNYASICGFITVGYFRDGECLVGCLLPVEGTMNQMAFVQPIVVSEGKKKRTASGFDLTGEIFIKTNSSNIVAYE